MDSETAGGVLRSFFQRLTSPEVLAEFIAILVAGLIALAAAQAVKAWYRRHESGRAGWQAHVHEVIVILTPILFALTMLLIVRGLLGVFEMHTAVLDIALQLTTALLIVRLSVYGLRQMFGAESWFRVWENRITFVLWAFVVFELLGWFAFAESTLDGIDLIPGTKEFSLWALLKAIVVVTGFVVASSVIARTLEKRVMRLEALAVSTRIGISKFSYFFLVGLGILLGVNAAGVDVTTLNVLTGAIGLGLGFGLQSITSNFVSGFVLLMDKSIKPGDVI